MPRFKVKVTYSYPATILIDATDERAALKLDGEIVEEDEETYNATREDTISCEQVGDEEAL